MSQGRGFRKLGWGEVGCHRAGVGRPGSVGKGSRRGVGRPVTAGDGPTSCRPQGRSRVVGAEEAV